MKPTQTESRRRNKLSDSAVKKFGTTNDFSDTAYILPDGRGVRFSSMGDHSEVFLAFPAKERAFLREAMDSELDLPTREFLMRTGSVRIALRDEEESGDRLYVHFDPRNAPTLMQMRRLREGVRNLNGQRLLVIEAGDQSFETKFARPADADRAVSQMLAKSSRQTTSRRRIASDPKS